MKDFVMKRLLLAITFMMASDIHASPLDDFRQNGQIGGFANLDFAMQNELNAGVNDAINYSTVKANAGTSAAIALGAMPEASAANSQALTLGIGSYNAGRALAVGYSKNAGRMGYKAGLAYTNENDIAVGAGLSYAF